MQRLIFPIMDILYGGNERVVGMSMWWIGMSVWCKRMSVWCMGMSVWCMGMSVWCMGMSMWCTGMSCNIDWTGENRRGVHRTPPVHMSMPHTHCPPMFWASFRMWTIIGVVFVDLWTAFRGTVCVCVCVCDFCVSLHHHQLSCTMWSKECVLYMYKYACPEYVSLSLRFV